VAIDADYGRQMRSDEVVAGQSVRCITADMQRRAHTGYELPPHHASDMELLGHEPCSQD
jgi:hypothetical protein